MAIKTYAVERTPEGVVCLVIKKGQESYFLKNVGYHSPSGFEMGYAGSGPADLALTILLDHFKAGSVTRNHFLGLGLPDGPIADAWRLHQDFKFKFITPHGNETVISSKEIQEWVDAEGARRVQA